MRPAALARIALAFAFLALAAPAHATFHLIEINKILTSYNGDTSIQAVEMRMLSGGQNLVSTGVMRTYDASGVLIATIGTFASDLPAAGALTDRKVLIATNNFATTFGITPDLIIPAGSLPLSTGQVSFEKGVCLVNAIAYGNVTTPKNGTTVAPEIPSGLAYVLTRTVHDGTLASCPLAEDAAARFAVRSSSTASPTPFSNNANATVNVMSTLTGVDGTPPPLAAPRVFPNPFRQSLRVVSPRTARVAVYDVRGALVRVLSDGRGGAAAFDGDWDGRDLHGKRVPAGVYFISFGAYPGARLGASGNVKRVAILR